jgi:type I restriction enzyme S subunit
MNSAVPEGWKVRPIGDLVTLQYGKSPKEVMAEDGQYPVIGTGGVTGYASSYLYDGCTTVIGRKGTINKPSYVEGKFWAIDTTYFGTGYEAAEPKWFYYSLNSFDLSKYNEASGVPSLGRDTLNAIPLLTPPLPEQQKIAAILSSVDDVIEKTRAQIDKLKDLKTGMMQELLTKGIGHTEFKDSALGQIPASWDVRYISDLCSHIVDCVNKTAPVVDHVTPYKMIRTTNVRNGRIVMDGMRYVSQETFQAWSRRLALRAGDLIFTREAPVGECGLVRNANGLFLGQRTMVYRAAPEKLDSSFLLWSMLSEYCQNQIQDLSGGSTTPHLRVPDCGKILLKVPPLAEQREISSAIQSVATLLEQKEIKVAHVTGLKKALMQDLLTGKVRVNVRENETAVA